MSEKKTQEFDEHQSFEDRVFARFDRLDEMDARFEGRLGAVEIRITKLEERQYDTRPIWEQALAAILEVKADVAEVKADVAVLKTDLAINTAETTKNTEGLAELRTEMRAGFAAIRHDMEHELRGVGRKLDALNHNILEVQADQRYVDSRLTILEEQTKST